MESIFMGKLRLDIKSNDILGVYGIVDLVFNGVTIESNKQLTADPIALEYNVDILTDADNTLKVSLLNGRPHDDKFMTVSVTALSYSADGVNFTTLLPQVATSYTVPDGLYAGNVLPLTESVTSFNVLGKNYSIAFNSDGIVNSALISGVLGKVDLSNETYQDLVTGITYDRAGNEI